MTLERWKDGTGTELVRLVECPFCESPIGPEDGRHRGRSTGAVSHLRSCAAFFEAMNVNPEKPLKSSRDTVQDEQDAAKTV